MCEYKYFDFIDVFALKAAKNRGQELTKNVAN